MKRGWILIFSVLVESIIVAAITILIWASFRFFPVSLIWYLFISIGGIAAMALLAFLLVYFWWAPSNLFFTFIPEGRAKVVVRADEARNILIQWANHELIRQPLPDKDKWDVIDQPTKKRKFGGLRFYGKWPLDDIYLYKFSWTNRTQNGEIKEHKAELLDYVLLKEDNYLFTVSQAEDKSLLPVDIRVVLTIRIINPYKALFNVQNWLEMIINRLSAAVRNIFTEDTYDNWISTDKDLADRIKTGLSEFLTAECKGHYGVDVRAIEVVDIDPSKDMDNPIRKATIQRYLAAKEAERRAGETIGALINMMAEATGKKVEEIQQMIDGNEQLKKKFQAISQDLIQRKMAIDGKSFADIRVSGARGIERMLLNLLSTSNVLSQTKNQQKTKTKTPTDEEEY